MWHLTGYDVAGIIFMTTLGWIPIIAVGYSIAVVVRACKSTAKDEE